MGKVAGAYRSILGGVSRQPAERRRENQAWEMTNMVADAREGLTRRNGAQWTDAKVSDLVPDTVEKWRTLDMDASDQAEWSPVTVAYIGQHPESEIGDIIPTDQRTGEIIPVVADVEGSVIPAFRTAVTVGRYGLFAPTYGAGVAKIAETNDWETEDNQKRHLIWVRGGAYSRKFRFALIRGNQKFWIEYTTMQASYPDTLDTSDIPSNDPDYTKKVNDRTNEYNSAVNEWIGRALADVQPQKIAENLTSELLASGFLGPDGVVEVIGTNICITDPTVEEIEADDSGDNTLMRGVGNTVGAPQLLSTYGFPGKIVRVRPATSSDGFVFYMKAVAKDGSTGKFTQVTWEETAGTSTVVTDSPFWFGTVEDGVFYLVDTPEKMAAITGDFPLWVGRLAGDVESSPTPRFFNRDIDCMFMFQDRLGVVSGSTISLSRPGDYLNFWRGSILTVAASDPIEFTIIGGENDIIRQALYYDRNVVLFGDSKQYMLNGREAMTPTSAAGIIMAQFKNASAVQPVLIGNLMFYATTGGDQVAPGIHQFQPGPITESPESNELTTSVRPYLGGDVLNLIADTQNKMLFARVEGEPYSLFVYQYQDNAAGTERVQDAWHRWDFPEHYGALVAATPSARGLLLLFAMQVTHPEGPGMQWSVGRVKLNEWTGPYLDMHRTAGTTFEGNAEATAVIVGDPNIYGVGFVMDGAVPYEGAIQLGNWWGDVTPEAASFAIINVETLEGSIDTTPTPQATTDAVVGDVFHSCWTPTSPWVRNNEGIAVTAGRLTVTKLDLTLKNTGGVKLSVHETDRLCWERELYVNGGA